MEYNPPDESWYESFEESIKRSEEDSAWEERQRKENPLLYRIYIGRCTWCMNSIWSNEFYYDDADVDEMVCKGCFE